jgi:hypothetical protein
MTKERVEASLTPPLSGKNLNMLHELFGCYAVRREIGRPVDRPRREDHIIPVLPYPDFTG